MRWRRRPASPHAFAPQERYGGLSEVEVHRLGTYNAERSRGLLHTPEWQEKMAGFQARFDAAGRERQQKRMSAGDPGDHS